MRAHMVGARSHYPVSSIHAGRGPWCHRPGPCSAALAGYAALQNHESDRTLLTTGAVGATTASTWVLLPTVLSHAPPSSRPSAGPLSCLGWCQLRAGMLPGHLAGCFHWQWHASIKQETVNYSCSSVTAVGNAVMPQSGRPYEEGNLTKGLMTWLQAWLPIQKPTCAQRACALSRRVRMHAALPLQLGAPCFCSWGLPPPSGSTPVAAGAAQNEGCAGALSFTPSLLLPNPPHNMYSRSWLQPLQRQRKALSSN